MRILITGGAGSVGKELTQRLVELGQQVRVFDLPVCDFSALETMAGVEIVRGDIGDADTVQAAVQGWMPPCTWPRCSPLPASGTATRPSV